MQSHWPRVARSLPVPVLTSSTQPSPWLRRSYYLEEERVITFERRIIDVADFEDGSIAGRRPSCLVSQHNRLWIKCVSNVASCLVPDHTDRARIHFTQSERPRSQKH